MKHRVVQLRSFRSCTIVAACFGAFALVCAYVIQSNWSDANREHAAPFDRPELTRDTARGGQPELSNLNDPSRLAELALSAALPGASTAQGKESKDLQLLAAQLLDTAGSLKLRRLAAWNLAKLGSSEALAVLRKGLVNAPAQLQATIAEALGHIDRAESREILRQLLTSGNEAVVRGAIRGWANLGDDEALQILAKLLTDPQRGDDLRTEAALSLSNVSSVRAYQVLVDSLNKANGRDMASSILIGLGQRSFAETEPFFRGYLASPDVPAELKAAAVEALGQADGDPTPLLLQQLESGNSRIRAAAAWALVTVDSPMNTASPLLGRLEREPDAEVRTRIYQALENQSIGDSKALFVSVLADQDAAARVAGLKLLAAQIARQSNAAMSAQFDSIAVPQLEQFALSGADLNNKLVSVMALKQARTAGAMEALNRVTAQSAEARISAASKLK